MMIYLAGPVFTLAERRFNEELAGELERLCPSLQVFLPQRYDKEFQGAPDFSQRMFACLMKALDNCEVVVAILDGPDADSGTSFEMGYARGRGKRVIGVRTNFRGGKDHGLNLMLSNACSDLVEVTGVVIVNRSPQKVPEVTNLTIAHCCQGLNLAEFGQRFGREVGEQSSFDHHPPGDSL